MGCEGGSTTGSYGISSKKPPVGVKLRFSFYYPIFLVSSSSGLEILIAFPLNLSSLTLA